MCQVLTYFISIGQNLHKLVNQKDPWGSRRQKFCRGEVSTVSGSFWKFCRHLCNFTGKDKDQCSVTPEAIYFYCFVVFIDILQIYKRHENFFCFSALCLFLFCIGSYIRIYGIVRKEM